MKLVIKSIQIYTNDGDENILDFSDSLNFIYGNVGAGKTTLINLIVYSFGGRLIYTPAVKSCLRAVKTNVVINDKVFSFFRATNSKRIHIYNATANKRTSVSLENISSFIFNECSLPTLYLSKGINYNKDISLSFNNFLWFSYLKQDEMDNSFYNLDSESLFKQNAAVNVLFTFFESKFIIDQRLNKRYREQRSRLKQYENSNKVFDYIERVFYYNGIDNKRDLNHVLNNLRFNLSELQNKQNMFTNQDVNEMINLQKQITQLDDMLILMRIRYKFNEAKKNIQKEIDIMSRQIVSEESRDNPNVQLLYDLFLDCLTNIGFLGVSNLDKVSFDPKTYMPVLSNQYNNRQVSFDNLGSGGKRTLFKICFSIAVHRYMHLKIENNYLPSFLIIDTPMKNISEREDAAMYERFYKYIFNLFSTDLSDTQLFIVDKEKKDFASFSFKTTPRLIHMTHDEIINPPLFKNYKEKQIEL